MIILIQKFRFVHLLSANQAQKTAVGPWKNMSCLAIMKVE